MADNIPASCLGLLRRYLLSLLIFIGLALLGWEISDRSGSFDY
jgi:hypothetical protein